MRSAGARAGRVTVSEGTRRGRPRGCGRPARRAGPGAPTDPPTVRATTAVLKNAWAARIAHTVPSRASPPSHPPGPSSTRKATPTTTVGSTNGTVTAIRSRVRPGSATRASSHATGIPTSQGQHGGRGGLAEGERGQARDVGLGEHPGHPERIEAAVVVDEAAAQDRRDRPGEEDGQKTQRDRAEQCRRKASQPRTPQPCTIARHCWVHASRLAEMVAGSTVRGVRRDGRERGPVRGQRGCRPAPGRRTCSPARPAAPWDRAGSRSASPPRPGSSRR